MQEERKEGYLLCAVRCPDDPTRTKILCSTWLKSAFRAGRCTENQAMSRFTRKSLRSYSTYLAPVYSGI